MEGLEESKRRDEAEALEIFSATGAIREGHFILAHGLHSDHYIAKELVFPYTSYLSLLCGYVAMRVLTEDIGAIVSPVIGGVALSQWLADHLTRMKDHSVLAFWAEKTGPEDFVLSREYNKLVAKTKVLIFDDILTTGRSIKGVIKAVEACDASVMGVAVLWSRGDVDLAVPKFFSLINIRFPVWPESECHLCDQGVPINTDFGRGRELI